MTPKQLQSRTERDLRKLVLDINKVAIRIGERFGDIDNCMVRAADDIIFQVERWVEERRKYMQECVDEALWMDAL